MPRKRIHIPPARPAMETRILLALRAGPLTRQQIEERIPGAHMDRLIGKGMVEFDRNGPSGLNALEYRLTDAGRAACPRWRDLCKPMSVLEGAPA